MEVARKAVVLILINQDCQVLLQHRDDDAPISPSQWGLFGGGVKPGETVRCALLREVDEELGYDAANATLAFVRCWSDADSARTVERYYFVEDYDNGQRLVLGEGQGMKWFAFDELSGLDLTSQITDARDQILSLLAKE